MQGLKRFWQAIWSLNIAPGSTTPLDVILSQAAPKKSVEIRVQWLCDLLNWIRRKPETFADALEERGRLQANRVRLLLQILEKSSDRKLAVAQTIRSILQDTSALDLFCETGLPNQHGLLREIVIRLQERLLPAPAYTGELGLLFDRLFGDEDDAAWIQRLDEATLIRIIDLIEAGASSKESVWDLIKLDMEEAMIQLAAQVRIAGSSQDIRSRIPGRHFRDLPFFKLSAAVDTAITWHRQNPEDPPTAELTLLHLQVDNAEKAIDTAFSQLEEFGVNTSIVYQLDRMRAQLQRIEGLLELLLDRNLPRTRAAAFVASLIRDHQSRQGVGSLISANWELLTRKLVERAAEAGENYIARDWKQYRSMFRSATGGGAIMALATWIKFGLASLPFPMLVQGGALSINYAVHFIAIQLSGSSLATKQPATTAPALAARLKNVRELESMERFVDEVAALIRSQVAAIVGNLIITMPGAFAIAWLGSKLIHEPLLTDVRAEQTIASLSLVSMTPIYAAMTGVGLWFTSLLGALADNWFALHRLKIGISQSPRLNFLFNPSGARRIADFLDKHLAGLVSNIGLGFFLGILPVLGNVTGLPLDIRHVTIASGQLAAALFTLGPEMWHEDAVWWAAAGVASVGIINVAVSFWLALFVAIRARDVTAVERRAIYRAVRIRMLKKPLSFLFPTSSSVTSDATPPTPVSTQT